MGGEGRRDNERREEEGVKGRREGKDRTFVLVSGSAENSTGSASNKIQKCTLPPHPIYQTLLSDFLRFWLRD